MPKHGKYAVSLKNFYGGKEIAITSDKNRATYLVRRGELYHVYFWAKIGEPSCFEPRYSSLPSRT